MTDAGDPGHRTPTPMSVDAGGPRSTLGNGRYRLLERLGAGGMGIVVAAHDELLGRDVAIKLLADNLAADPEARTRFEREAQAAARITHPNVVQIFDVGEDDGRPYFVMELVDGPSLSGLLERRGPLPSQEVEAIAVQALQGLARAHAAGLLHRDVKPGNLLRAPDGTIKVTDFGVAQASELPNMTRTGLVLGTLPYLAPERLQGAPASVRTDLYGLGATLLELLTGSTDAREDVTEGDGAVAAAIDTVPPRLAGVIQSCLARDPQRRPRSAQAALELLEGSRPLPTQPLGDRDDRDATRVLTAAEETPTEVVTGDPRTVVPARPRDRHRQAETPPAGRRTARSIPWLVLAGAAVLIVAALIWLGDAPGTTPADDGAPAGEEAPAEPAGGPEEPAGGAEQPAGGAGDPAGEPGGRGDGPPPGDTPAETVRELGDWIRDQVGD